MAVSTEEESCIRKCSRELLDLEGDDVSEEVHVARLLTANHTTVGHGRAGKIQKLPPSAVLSRVADFLPKLQEANDKTKAAMERGEDLNIENVDGVDRIIEMNLSILKQESNDDYNEVTSDTTDDSSSDSSSVEDADTHPNCKKRLVIELTHHVDQG